MKLQTKLRPYQLEGARQIRKFGGRALLADEMGLGKSLQALYYGAKVPSSVPVLIVCPAAVKYNWQREAWKHLRQRAVVLEGTRPPPGFELNPDQIYVVNYDILGARRTKKGSSPGWIKFLKKLRPQLVIIDEVHYIKNRGTKRYKATKDIATGARRVIALSGTPLTSRPAELWPTLNIICPEEFPNFREFAERYCQPTLTRWGWQYKGAAHTAELHTRLKKHCMVRRLKKDVLKELPAKQRIVQYLDLPDPVEYRNANADFLGWLKSQSAVKAKKAARAEAVTKMSYLKGICARQKVGPAIQWIEDFLENSDGKLVLFGIRKALLRPIFEHFRSRAVLVVGGMSPRKKDLAVQEFIKRKEVRLAVCNMKAAGTGIDGMQEVAAVSCTLELDWVPAHHTQAEDRLHRIGQLAHTVMYYLLFKDTLEVPMCEIISGKATVVDEVLDGTEATATFDIVNALMEALST
mgnify:CR=1 FL=1